MEREHGAAGVTLDHGLGAVCGEVSGEEMCLLE